MNEQWLTHPKLTPAHDFKGHISAWLGSGWQVREDQSDPAPAAEQDTDATPEAPSTPPKPAPSRTPKES